MRAACLAALLAVAPAAAQTATTPGAPGAEAAVAAYLAAFGEGDLDRAFARTDPAETRELADLLGGLVGTADKEAASAPKALARVMAEVFAADPDVAEALSSVEGAVLGSVLEGDSLAHVVARASVSVLGGSVSGVDVTTARWDGRRWWITFGAELEAFRRGLEMADADASDSGDA